METEVPLQFKTLRDYIRNDLNIITSLKEGSPNYAAALLLTVASEALSKLLGKKEESVFVEELLGKYVVPLSVRRTLFNAVRNGLAHLYETKVIALKEPQESWTIVLISWKTCTHLDVIMGDWFHDGVERPAVCLNVQTIWADLDSYINQVESQLLKDLSFRYQMVNEITKLEGKDLRIPLENEAAREWNDFVNTTLAKRTPS